MIITEYLYKKNWKKLFFNCKLYVHIEINNIYFKNICKLLSLIF